jgi:hypothetical protein
VTSHRARNESIKITPLADVDLRIPHRRLTLQEFSLECISTRRKSPGVVADEYLRRAKVKGAMV